MTSPVTGPSTPQQCPAHEPFSFYGPELTESPTELYGRLRKHGPVVPILLTPGVPAMLVVGYQAALDVMRDPETFPRNPRIWQQSVPEDCPVLPMMAFRPNCLLTDGAVHARVRAAVSDSLDRVDLSALRVEVEVAADALISRFASAGEADLVTQYAAPLPLMIFNHLFGCPPEFEDRLVAGFRAVMDAGQSGDAQKANVELTQCLFELVSYKRSKPGTDVISWMLAHPAGLTDEEMVHQLAMLLGAGSEPNKGLISNALRFLLSDERFAGGLYGGSLHVEDAIDEVLWTEPPLANYGATYPERDLDFAGVRLPANQPVVTSYAGANTDPSVASTFRTGNRAHLAWGAGPHACPAQRIGRLIASAAIEKLLDRLPDIRLATAVDELRWVPAPFFRTLQSLPACFPAVPRHMQPGPVESAQEVATRQTNAAGSPSVPASGAGVDTRTGWWAALVRWWDYG